MLLRPRALQVDGVAYSATLASLLKGGRAVEALAMFLRLKSENKVALDAIACLAALEAAQELYRWATVAEVHGMPGRSAEMEPLRCLTWALPMRESFLCCCAVIFSRVCRYTSTQWMSATFAQRL